MSHYFRSSLGPCLFSPHETGAFLAAACVTAAGYYIIHFSGRECRGVKKNDSKKKLEVRDKEE
jgi:hypothetical protein